MIVLASQSASRRAMLDAAGVSYVAKPARIDERALEQDMAGAGPEAIVLALSKAKAVAAGTPEPGQLVLGGDSLVVVAGKRFDKPRSRDEAAEHLRFFSGQSMQLHSGAVLLRDGAVVWRHAALASLQLRDLSPDFIEEYLDAEWPEIAGCAGAFRIEARGVQLFEHIEGDQFTILGMPLLPLLGALRDLGELPA